VLALVGVMNGIQLYHKFCISHYSRLRGSRLIRVQFEVAIEPVSGDLCINSFIF